MSNIKVVLNRQAVSEQLLKSQWMLDICTEYANQIKATAGEGYEVSPHVGQNRVNVSVGTETDDAAQDNLDNNTLLKALGSVHQQ